MPHFVVSRRVLLTKRLTLRPTSEADTNRACEIRTDWNVTRMLSKASFPPDRNETHRWFADHEREWFERQAFRFAVDLAGRMIGLVDIEAVNEVEGYLGYWLETSAWGHGYALEAARAVVKFAFLEVGLSRLRAGHAIDNPASGRLLAKLGFNPVDTVLCFSRPRGENIWQCRYLLISCSS
jgi:[ribosomal protein S5]-alanine N-acetyltransferase